ncbi:MAG: hypothetical protein KAW86_01635 [Bacteroidales bacterium]|nr:hypothetical protein [Bacteroidales bacterium]
MKNQNNKPELFDALITKATLKQDVYSNTFNTFKLFKSVIKNIVTDFHKKIKHTNENIPFEYKNKGEFEIELKFGGDILIFMMHTNVFEFSRDHFVMRTSYIKEDINRSYCGVINIYNFLGDSFKYRRINDIGYMIGRIFVNKDMHYFIEGKREIGLLYNNFVSSIMDKKAAKEIVESAIRYTINFDLLTPPYERVKEVSVNEFLSTLDTMTIKTGKRLGFKFQADEEEIV